MTSSEVNSLRSSQVAESLSSGSWPAAFDGYIEIGITSGMFGSRKRKSASLLFFHCDNLPSVFDSRLAVREKGRCIHW